MRLLLHEFQPFLSDMGNSFGGLWPLLGDFNFVMNPVEKSSGHRLICKFDCTRNSMSR
jgi:hypothetical protein